MSCTLMKQKAIDEEDFVKYFCWFCSYSFLFCFYLLTFYGHMLCGPAHRSIRRFPQGHDYVLGEARIFFFLNAVECSTSSLLHSAQARASAVLALYSLSRYRWLYQLSWPLLLVKIWINEGLNGTE